MLSAEQQQDHPGGDARHSRHYPESWRAAARRPVATSTPGSAQALEAKPEDREAFWEKLYGTPGFGQWQANFSDMLTDREANALASEFAARKIRERVNDPVVAEKLIPKNHGFGTRRIPLESGYYDVYNQPNVELVDVNERRSSASPCTASGRRTASANSTSSSTRRASTLLSAPLTGSISEASTECGSRRCGRTARRPISASSWPGFRFLMAMGPHAGLSNYTRTAEYSVEWVTGVIRFATERGLGRIEATPSAVNEWTDHVLALGQVS